MERARVAAQEPALEPAAGWEAARAQEAALAVEWDSAAVPEAAEARPVSPLPSVSKTASL
jgi:hypothetical protein